MAIVLRGTVVTMDRDHRVLGDGAVYIGDDGRLADVLDAGDPEPTGFDTANEIDTDAVIYPGLVDLHSHVAYNTSQLWQAPRVPYRHHDSWTGEDRPPDYATSVNLPTKVFGRAAGEALIKFVEVKALVGGTTSIQGAPKVTKPVKDWLIRIVDVETLPRGEDMVLAAALQKNVAALQKDAAKLDGTRVLIYHVAEGLPGTVVHDEFVDVDTAGCLKPGFIAVHATAMNGDDFRLWQRDVAKIDPHERGTVVWSPFSNLWLYHTTTDVVEAQARGLRIALGSDWSPSGTKHVLGELKVADDYNRHTLNGHFSDQELCDMVTANPGDALATAWGPQVGRLQKDNLADVLVLERHNNDDLRNLIEATERHVRLVIARGKPFYGTTALMKAAGAGTGDTNPITVAGLPRRVAVRQAGADAKLDWPGVIRALNKVRANPAKAFREAQDAIAAWGGALDDPQAPLIVFGDMPEGDLGAIAGADDIPPDLKIAPLDTLFHDAAFFDAVAESGPPELQRLADYYR
jgi:5-methylthioadenosine/S-adenosylhomocysteine deaminase